MGDGNQIIGLVRFSYISKGGFAHSHDPQQEQERFIYDPARLERRFSLFEKLCLPGLKYQSDQDFKVIFLITQSFPRLWRDRLEEAVAGWAPGLVMAKPFMPQFRAIRACYEETVREDVPFTTTFRLDDDDMLDRDFIARLKRVSLPLTGVKGDGAPVIISFNRGVYLEIGAKGNRIFDACERTPLSVGTGMITPTGARENVYSRNHRKLAAFFTAYSDVDAPS
ncbi:MAG: glycosyltransferase, partial [Pseudomonadota bacterium]